MVDNDTPIIDKSPTNTRQPAVLGTLTSLVVAQVALAVMIASGATPFARSVANMYAVQPGAPVNGVAVFDMVFDGTLDRTGREKTLGEIERALRELPGVASVGATQTLPLRGGKYRAPWRIDERPDIEGMVTECRVVTATVRQRVASGPRQTARWLSV